MTGPVYKNLGTTQSLRKTGWKEGRKRGRGVPSDFREGQTRTGRELDVSTQGLFRDDQVRTEPQTKNLLSLIVSEVPVRRKFRVKVVSGIGQGWSQRPGVKGIDTLLFSPYPSLFGSSV